MLKKLETREIKATGGWPGSRQIERSNILTHEVDSILKLQSMVGLMVKNVKQITDKAEQKAEANSEVKRLSTWMAEAMQWDAEQAIRELARAQW